MQTKLLLLPAILLALVCTPIAFADEIVVADAITSGISRWMMPPT